MHNTGLRVSIQAALLLAKATVQSLEQTLQEINRLEEYIDDDRDFIPYVDIGNDPKFFSNSQSSGPSYFVPRTSGEPRECSHNYCGRTCVP